MVIRHLYLHIPFCHRICPYCAFYKHQPGESSTSAFVDALLGELDAHLQTHEVVPHTIYLGGGTLVQLHIQGLGVEIEAQYLSMLPYLITILVLAIISHDKTRSKMNAPGCLGRSFYASS